MTDYSSQGRKQKFNVVDIHNCCSHQSIYTCLSQGSTSNGTLITQDFTNEHITGGPSGYLRQEFRELELLDEITCLWFEKTLPAGVGGITRNHLIWSYCLKKGCNYIPKNMPVPLWWTKDDEYKIDDILPEIEWQIIHKNKRKKQPSSQNNTEGQKACKQAKTNLRNYVPAQDTIQLIELSNTQGTQFNNKHPAQLANNASDCSTS
jgi:hypothetical protein